MIQVGDRVRRIHPVNTYALQKDGMVENGIYKVVYIDRTRITLAGIKHSANPNFFRRHVISINALTRIL